MDRFFFVISSSLEEPQLLGPKVICKNYPSKKAPPKPTNQATKKTQKQAIHIFFLFTDSYSLWRLFKEYKRYISSEGE